MLVKTNNKMKKKKQIKKIIKNFDFEKVHKVMESLNWRWVTCHGVPSIEFLKESAKSKLNEAYVGLNPEIDDYFFTSSGGFKAECRIINDKKKLSLTFELECYDYFFH